MEGIRRIFFVGAVRVQEKLEEELSLEKFGLDQVSYIVITARKRETIFGRKEGSLIACRSGGKKLCTQQEEVY